ncbi:unnamed protein product [Cylindrotheca closterium]|uniref:WD repeat protein mio zinc-ribbon like domain-containing protein n=1 Tax=Cylindrotheca closterium TaxID=2856 RepID=A0AAD2CB57_9STRA|nr:unnamed protein product [Cylindrotheca closterium]
MSRQQDNESSIPHAPYPPQFESSIKSASIASPNYKSRSAYPGIERSAAAGGYENASRAGDDLSPAGTSAAEKGKADRHIPARIKFYHKPADVVACINCKPSKHNGAKRTVSIEKTKSRKAPLLLELRQLQPMEDYTDDAATLFGTRLCGTSRGNPSLGSNVVSTCLDLPLSINHSQSRFTAATGSSTGMLCIHSIFADSDMTSSIEYFHIPRRQATATSVAWSPTQSNAVAIGLLGNSPSLSQVQPHRRGAGATRTSGGDRDWGCIIWDVEKQQSTARSRNPSPLSKLSHNSPVTALAWLVDGQKLAVGAGTRGLSGQSTIQLFDMRVSGTNAPPISAPAHDSGVHGIEIDSLRPNVLASFSQAAGEPVKLWDIRRMDSVLGEIKVVPNGASATPADDVVEAVKWAIHEPGILTVASGGTLHDFDTKVGSRPTLVAVKHTRKGSRIRDFALYPNRQGDGSNEAHNPLVDKLYNRRALTVLEEREVFDMAKHTNAPVSISHRDGSVVHSLGASLFVEAPTSGESAIQDFVTDISEIMRRRANGKEGRRYCMNTQTNTSILTAELGFIEPSSDTFSQSLSLLWFWTWIDRVERICDKAEGEGFGWTAKNLCDAGCWSLLGFDTESAYLLDQQSVSETFGCKIYDSTSRRHALASCGWAGMLELDDVLKDYESIGEFERSAALAVWHGDIGAAVQALHHASNTIRLSMQQGESEESTYAETLDLISMCIAGFGSSSGSVWQTACSTLLRRPDLKDESKDKGGRVAYLRALCEFLLKVGTQESIEEVLWNVQLSLSDRIAFACRYLGQKELRSYLSMSIKSCQASGNIEGLVASGLSKEGIKILQCFVDNQVDIQTAALVVSRAILPPSWTQERKACMEWVESYRALLNGWQMWTSRAMYDVDRAALLRRIKAKNTEAVSVSGVKPVPLQNRRAQGANRRQGSRSVDPEFLQSIPPQIDARCNYCSTPLPLTKGVASQFLSRMKPQLSCCVHCRKPLPRCSVCLLPLGCLNPYIEFTKDRSRTGPRGTSSLASSDDLSSLANLPFAEWFTWCVKCKHGGHAHHLVGWFSDHETCPVSGCDCRCHFDSIKKVSQSVDAALASELIRS